jgi:hypothetical protein
MWTNGYFSKYSNNKMGFNFDELEGMSMRHKRFFYKNKVVEKLKSQKLSVKLKNKASP